MLTCRMFESLRDAGHIYTKMIEQAYDEQEKMFLPDRFVKGTCPRCKTEDQYGDACENCGATYTPNDLIDPVSVLSGLDAGLAAIRTLLFQTERIRRSAARLDR